MILGLVTIGNIGASFFIQLLMFTVIGANKETDIFIISSAAPLLLSSVISGIFNNLLIPFFSTEESNSQSGLLSDVFIIIFLGALCFTFAIYLSSFMWFGYLFNPETLHELAIAKHIFNVQLITMFFTVIYSVIWAYINSLGFHFRSEFIPFLLSLVAIPFAYYLLPMYGVVTMAYIVMIKTIICTLIQGYGVLRVKCIWLNKRILVVILAKIKPVLIASIYYKSDFFIERFLLMSSSAGTLSLFNLAQQLINAGLQVATKAVVTPNIKSLGYSYRSGLGSYKLAFYKKLRLLIILLLIASVPFAIFPEIFKGLLYFSTELKNKYYEIWVFFSLMLGLFISNSIASLVNGSFYIYGDTKTPSKISSIIYTFYIPIKIIIFYQFGILAMVVSTSIYSFINVIVLIFYHRRLVLK